MPVSTRKHATKGVGLHTCHTKEDAKESRIDFIFLRGPLDPEHGRTSPGVGILCINGLVPYQVPKPTQDYFDAYETGRCAICCFDLGAHTLTVAVVYG